MWGPHTHGAHTNPHSAQIWNYRYAHTCTTLLWLGVLVNVAHVAVTSQSFTQKALNMSSPNAAQFEVQRGGLSTMDLLLLGASGPPGAYKPAAKKTKSLVMGYAHTCGLADYLLNCAFGLADYDVKCTSAKPNSNNICLVMKKLKKTTPKTPSKVPTKTAVTPSKSAKKKAATGGASVEIADVPDFPDDEASAAWVYINCCLVDCCFCIDRQSVLKRLSELSSCSYFVLKRLRHSDT